MTEPAAGRLDAELVRRGLSRSRALAVAAITQGRVRVDGRRAGRAALRVTAESDITVAGESHWVSRAAEKLASGLDEFPVDPAGRVALDVGASTGGFTQVLLERGVAEVIALDVGHGQLVDSIRSDPRVRVVEGVNARELTRELLARASGTTAVPDLVVVDVSFISLTQVLPAVVTAVAAASRLDVVLLVKPQFEVGRTGVRDGIVVDPELRRASVRAVVRVCEDLGLLVGGIVPSPLVGTHGNHEYLLWACTGDGSSRQEWEDAIAALP